MAVHLIQILLPLRDDKGRNFSPAKYDSIADELTDRFGGVTAYTRTPAQGRWKGGSQRTSEEDIVVMEVMVAHLEPKWWREYRTGLERTFEQESIVVRAQEIERL